MEHGVLIPSDRYKLLNNLDLWAKVGSKFIVVIGSILSYIKLNPQDILSWNPLLNDKELVNAYDNKEVFNAADVVYCAKELSNALEVV